MDPALQQSQQQEVPQPIPSQTLQQEKYHPLVLKSLGVAIGVIVVLGFIGGAFYLETKINPANIPPVKMTAKPTRIYTPSPKVNGKIYTNNQFDYTIIYPTDWQAVEAPSLPVTYPPITEQPQYGGYLQKGELQKTTFVKADIGSCYLSVLENPNHMDLDQWSSSYKVLAASGINLAKVTEDTTLGGGLAKTVSIFAFDHSNTAIVAEHTDNIYFFEYSNTKGNPNYNQQQQTAETICLQIASSFRFLK